MSFSAHAKQICTKLNSRNNVLKSLAGSTCGKKNTYYAASVWTPQPCDTSWTKLQSSQNASLRSASLHIMRSVCEQFTYIQPFSRLFNIFNVSLYVLKSKKFFRNFDKYCVPFITPYTAYIGWIENEKIKKYDWRLRQDKINFPFCTVLILSK